MNFDDHIWIQTPGMQWESLIIIYLAVNANQSNEKRKIKELQPCVIDSERLAIEEKKLIINDAFRLAGFFIS